MNLKELKALIKLCRDTGVTEIETTGIKLKLGELPQVAPKATKQQPHTAYAPGGITEDTRIQTDELTDDQLLFYSAVQSATDSQQ